MQVEADPPGRPDAPLTVRGACVVLVGALPPPVHGMAMINAAVRDELRRRGACPLVLNIGGATLARSSWARLTRLPRVLSGWVRVLFGRQMRGGSLYMSLSGGWGQAYEIPFALAARLRGMHVVLHHHSFAYLDRRRRLTRVLLAAAGDATHVVLSAGMAERLTARYPRVRQVVAVSNAALMAHESMPRSIRVRHDLRIIGFIGNVCEEKGILEFLDLMQAAQTSGFPLRGRIAGPFQDADIERRVRIRLAGLDNVEYVGPKYGADKERFFETLDALVFPTRYANEAEPLTIHEAMSRGLPVIASDRGAIGEVIGPDCGCVVAAGADFVDVAMSQLADWSADPAGLAAASKSALERFDALSTRSVQRWNNLLAGILQASPPERLPPRV